MKVFWLTKPSFFLRYGKRHNGYTGGGAGGREAHESMGTKRQRVAFFQIRSGYANSISTYGEISVELDQRQSLGDNQIGVTALAEGWHPAQRSDPIT